MPFNNGNIRKSFIKEPAEMTFRKKFEFEIKTIFFVSKTDKESKS